MKDPLRDYFKKHRPPTVKAPADEYAQILARTGRRKPRVLYYVSAATLAAASMLAVINLKAWPEGDTGLEAEDVFYQVDSQDPGAYQDWLVIADQVVDEAGP